MFESTPEWYTLAPEHFLKLCISFVCGLLLGVERERREKPAGLRTIVLITIGSTLFMIVGDLVALVSQGPESVVRADPTRIGSQVVTGIGFLGAGTIIQARGSIHGLTTAATIWVAAAVGLCVGVGFYATALGTALLVLMALTLLEPLTERFRNRSESTTLHFSSPNDSLSKQAIRLLLLEYNVEKEGVEHEVRDENCYWTVTTLLRNSGLLQLVHSLRDLDCVDGLPKE